MNKYILASNISQFYVKNIRKRSYLYANVTQIMLTWMIISYRVDYKTSQNSVSFEIQVILKSSYIQSYIKVYVIIGHTRFGINAIDIALRSTPTY